MAVQIALVKDGIRKAGARSPRIVQKNKVDFDTLLGFMDKLTGLSQSDLRSVFLQFAEALVFYFPSNSEVQTPVGTFSLGVKYPPIAAGNPSDPQSRKITADNLKIKLRADHSLLERIRFGAAVSLVDAPAIQTPVVTRVANVNLDGAVGSGSVGQFLHIQGSRLSFDKADPEQGVFFVSSDPVPVATRMTVYSRQGTTTVDGMIPDLAPGDYGIQVRTRPTATDIRVGPYDGTIVIS